MALAFRNLTITPDAPVSVWPTEAVQIALERGDLDDWRRIVAEIKREPWGRTARRIEEVLSYSRPYGIAEAMEAVIAEIRAGVEARERMEVVAEIRDAIRRSGLSQSQFAAHIGPPSAGEMAT